MSSIVVWLSVVFGVGFTLAYVLIPRLKREVEAPKYIFQKQLQRYDSQAGEHAFSKESRNEEK
jgi:uncharacterized membrane protein YciS (DUF1049 family)